MIVAREKVASALVRAREHAETVDEACAVVAQAMGVAVEAVREVADDAAAHSEGDLA